MSRIVIGAIAIGMIATALVIAIIASIITIQIEKGEIQ